MKTLVINGSPRGAAGNTEKLVQAFLEGVNESGGASEVVYLKDKNIKHCTGCFACWTKTPGVCIHKDDMPELLEKVKEAQLIVLATPLYIYTVSGMMKDFMDRLIPLVQPYIDVKNGLCSHPSRYTESGESAVVLISNSGFPEQDHFSGLKETVRRCYRGEDGRLAGMICCAGGVLLGVPELESGLTWYLDAVRLAGREVAANRKISPETASLLDRPLIEDQELFAQMANASWAGMGIERIGDPCVSAESSPVSQSTLIPPPTELSTVKDLVGGMAASFNSESAGDMKAVLQFIVTDEIPGRYYVEIGDGKCLAYEGEHPSPNITITTPSKVWMDISTGKLNGATAFLTGKYKVSGDIQILMKLNKLFSTR